MMCFRDEPVDVLCVADWGQNLSFYTLSGKQVCRSESLLIVIIVRLVILVLLFIIIIKQFLIQGRE